MIILLERKKYSYKIRTYIFYFATDLHIKKKIKYMKISNQKNYILLRFCVAIFVRFILSAIFMKIIQNISNLKSL